MAKTYNGHPSYNAWNVSLHLNNDEWLYNLMRDELRTARKYPSKDGKSPVERAAIAVLSSLNAVGIYFTGDGVAYTKTNIIRAMRGLR